MAPTELPKMYDLAAGSRHLQTLLGARHGVGPWSVFFPLFKASLEQQGDKVKLLN